MNLNILDFAGKKVVSGFVESIGEPGRKGDAILVPAVIKNKAYIDGRMQDTKLNIVFVNNAKLAMASFIKGQHVGQRITVLIIKHEGMAYAMKATADTSFIWQLSDGQNVRNVIYGDVHLDRMDEKQRYAKVITNIDGVEYATTFWNNETSPMGERIRKVFEKVASKQTFLVCGENKPFNGKPSMRGFWFICD